MTKDINKDLDAGQEPEKGADLDAGQGDINVCFYAVACERGLNLRNAPRGKVIVILPHRHEVMCAAVDGDMPEWIEADVGEGVRGWVMSKYLEKVL